MPFKEFLSMKDFVEEAERRKVTISQVAIEIEAKKLEDSEEHIRTEMKRRLQVMYEAVAEGLKGNRSISGLTGGDGLKFKHYMESGQSLASPLYSKAISYAIAANEANAGMGRIVAAPTAGSAGIFPGIFLALKEEFGFSDEKMTEGLFTAGAVGLVIGDKACFAGAEGGCQAECGSAAAMAAVAMAEVMGCSPRAASDAGAIALKGMLGLVCDPVAGLVEVPCVKRNMSATVQVLAAVDMVRAGITSVIPLDEVIEAMGAIGKQLPSCLRETAQGGLAVTPTGLELKKKIFG